MAPRGALGQACGKPAGIPHQRKTDLRRGSSPDATVGRQRRQQARYTTEIKADRVTLLGGGGGGGARGGGGGMDARCVARTGRTRRATDGADDRRRYSLLNGIEGRGEGKDERFAALPRYYPLLSSLPPRSDPRDAPHHPILALTPRTHRCLQSPVAGGRSSVTRARYRRAPVPRFVSSPFTSIS